MSMVVATSSHF